MDNVCMIKGVGSFFELGGLNSGVDQFFGWGGGNL